MHRLMAPRVAPPLPMARRGASVSPEELKGRGGRRTRCIDASPYHARAYRASGDRCAFCVSLGDFASFIAIAGDTGIHQRA